MLGRLALLLASTLVIAIVTLGSMFFSVATARAQVGEAKNAALSSAADVAEQIVLSYIGEAESVSRDLAGDLGIWTYPFESLDTELLRQLQVHEAVRAITVTYPDGTFVLARRDVDGFVTRVIDPAADPAQTFTEYDLQGRWMRANHDVVEFPTTTAPSYIVAEQADGVQWTEPALRVVTKRPGVWAATAARDTEGSLIAVVAADIDVERLETALEAPSFGDRGEAFVLGADRTVVAAPPRYTDAIAAYADNYGLVAPAATLGMATSKVAEPHSVANVFGHSGELLTVERGLGESGPPWLVHVQASPEAINPGVAQIANTLTLPLVLGSVAFLMVVWSAVAARSLFGMARRTSWTDPSSGLLTPKGMEKNAARQIRKIRLADRVLCVAVLRVDDLEELARARGIFAYESALQAVGEIIRLETRSSDTAVRQGSGEFVVLISLAIEGDAVVAVERIRSHVADSLDLRFGVEPRLIVTAGYCVARDGQNNIDELIEHAREAFGRHDASASGPAYGTLAP